ncbi:hypothetical protein BCR44DRAFT_1426647, partial [Catenaria anguillulae PL171]
SLNPFIPSRLVNMSAPHQFRCRPDGVFDLTCAVVCIQQPNPATEYHNQHPNNGSFRATIPVENEAGEIVDLQVLTAGFFHVQTGEALLVSNAGIYDVPELDSVEVIAHSVLARVPDGQQLRFASTASVLGHVMGDPAPIAWDSTRLVVQLRIVPPHHLGFAGPMDVLVAVPAPLLNAPCAPWIYHWGKRQTAVGRWRVGCDIRVVRNRPHQPAVRTSNSGGSASQPEFPGAATTYAQEDRAISEQDVHRQKTI